MPNEIRLSAMIDAAKAFCPKCAGGIRINRDVSGAHTHFTGGALTLCPAANIHAMIDDLDEKSEEVSNDTAN